jgi:hypothetical protein
VIHNGVVETKQSTSASLYSVNPHRKALTPSTFLFRPVAAPGFLFYPFRV